jgi:hypothetical protein
VQELLVLELILVQQELQLELEVLEHTYPQW